MIKSVILAASLALAAGAAAAETHEVQMLNRGEAGMMVFEPAFVKAAPGDTIHFVPTDKGHNVESIDGMLPEGVDSFRTKFNQEFELEVTQDGVYGVKCTPHYGMGMVALIQVGDPVNLDAAGSVDHRGKANDRMSALLDQVQ